MGFKLYQVPETHEQKFQAFWYYCSVLKYTCFSSKATACVYAIHLAYSASFNTIWTVKVTKLYPLISKVQIHHKPSMKSVPWNFSGLPCHLCISLIWSATVISRLCSENLKHSHWNNRHCCNLKCVSYNIFSCVLMQRCVHWLKHNREFLITSAQLESPKQF